MSSGEEEKASHREVQVDSGGTRLTILRKNLEESDEIDSCFFDETYTVAAATGFAVWEGTWYLLDTLQTPESAEALRYIHVLELGSGTGVLGLAVAALGCHVLMTDVASVADEMLPLNLAHNGRALAEAELAAVKTWPGAYAIGQRGGTASTARLDWTLPLDVQACAGGFDPRMARLILAAETLWLKELVEPFTATVVALLRARAAALDAGVDGGWGGERGGTLFADGPCCLLCYRNRGTASSELFAVTEEVQHAFAAAGCTMRVLSEGDSQRAPGKPCTLYAVTLNEKGS